MIFFYLQRAAANPCRNSDENNFEVTTRDSGEYKCNPGPFARIGGATARSGSTTIHSSTCQLPRGQLGKSSSLQPLVVKLISDSPQNAITRPKKRTSATTPTESKPEGRHTAKSVFPSPHRSPPAQRCLPASPTCRPLNRPANRRAQATHKSATS